MSLFVVSALGSTVWYSTNHVLHAWINIYVCCLELGAEDLSCCAFDAGWTLVMLQKLYTVLGEVLEDLDEDVLPLAAVHMGGEEVHWGCWSIAAIERWAVDHELSQLPAGHDESVESKRAATFENDAAHKAYAYFQERLHNTLLPSLPSMRWRRPIVWEDVLFEAPSWARSRLHPSDRGRMMDSQAAEAPSKIGWMESAAAGDRVIVEVFKRPKGNRMSLFNATALGYDALFTNVDALYLDFGHDWSQRYRYTTDASILRPPSTA